jgi:hypothetical protein
MHINPQQLRWLRMRAQRLILPKHQVLDTPESVLQAVTGLQAQDLPSARLGMRIRSRGLTDDQIQKALTEPRRLAVAWTMRGTLHLHSAADAAWLVPFLGPTFIAADARRMRELGWDEPTASRGLDLLRQVLMDEGGLTRAEIIQRLAEAGLPSEGQAPIHLIGRAALEGWLSIGPPRGKDETYLPFQRWIGRPQLLPRKEALGRLARRYLVAYGPSTPDDFASWAKLKTGDIREGWDQLRAEITALDLNGQTVWLLKSQLEGLDEFSDLEQKPVVRLLPRFDTLLLGYTGRDWLVDPAFARQVHPGGGMIRAALLVNGELRGTWKIRALKSGLVVEVTPFELLPENILPALEGEGSDLGRFLGQDVTNVILLSHSVGN